MGFYSCDLGTRYPGTELPEVLESARLTPKEAGRRAADALKSDFSLRGQVTFEELETLLTEAGERSLNLSALVKGEVLTLMKHKGEAEVYYDSSEEEWVVIVPSGTISFAEMEDFCVEISGAKFTGPIEEDSDDSYFG